LLNSDFFRVDLCGLEIDVLRADEPVQPEADQREDGLLCSAALTLSLGDGYFAAPGSARISARQVVRSFSL